MPCKSEVVLRWSLSMRRSRAAEGVVGCLRSRRRPLSTKAEAVVKSEQDEEREWAEHYKSKGGTPCLDPPSVRQCPRLQRPFTFPASFEAFLESRKWPMDEDDKVGMRILSGLLSYPLTLAQHLSWWHQHRGMMAGTTGPEPIDRIKVLCLGARAEASLPPPYWRELLCTTNPVNDGPTIDMHMIGPELPLSPKDPISIRLGEEEGEGKCVELRLFYFKDLGALHKTVSTPEDPVSTFALFNPGLGHPQLKENWRETVRLVLSHRVPVLYTAHSERDRDRDMAVMDEYDIRWLQMPHANPFGSRRRMLDPLDKSHVVSANAFVGVFAAQ